VVATIDPDSDLDPDLDETRNHETRNHETMNLKTAVGRTDFEQSRVNIGFHRDPRRTYLVQNAILIGTTEHTKHTETEPCLSVCLVCSVVKQSIPIAIPIPIWMKP